MRTRLQRQLKTHGPAPLGRGAVAVRGLPGAVQVEPPVRAAAAGAGAAAIGVEAPLALPVVDGSSAPSQENARPLFWASRASTRLMRSSTERSAPNSRPLGTLRRYGRERAVSTVPGWRATHRTWRTTGTRGTTGT
ncbi:hypothetical protein EYF80_057859 [Liparis tanakae]|uniref:Uncharacterized protein n=1 Tax=Liparis tanakae TaxID=230148 RepID=A0A4Z2ETS3_9TELE|nr:hypothetical protein EYF80_057859 [Liparis tanakae]